MKMKKLALSMAIAAAAGTAQAVVESEYSVGVLVPNVIFDTQGNTTAVGIVSRKAARVYWTFFDENSNHVTDGQFDMTANDYHSFIWRDEAGVGLEGQRGYLVFVADVGTTTTRDGVITSADAAENPIAGHAVQVLPPNDVAYVPAFPLTAFDLSDFPVAPTDLGPSDVDYLVAGANCYEGTGTVTTGTIGTLTEQINRPYVDDIDMRYFIDGSAGGTDTNIAVWSAADISGTHTVNMFDDNQNRKSVNFTLPKKELNFIDVESIAGRPANFKDGFIRWDVPCGKNPATGTAATFNGVVTFSVISAPDFGAVQTIVNPFGANVSP